jgi:hypothetical protein
MILVALFGQLAVGADDQQMTTYIVRHGEQEGVFSTRAPTGTLVYSNTTGEYQYSSGIAYTIADDASLATPCACRVSALVVKVTGGGDGTGPGFSVYYGLYPACPTSGGGIDPLPGSAGTFVLPDDGAHVIEIDYSGYPVAVPSSLWVGLRPSVASMAWVVGSSPEVGFSWDHYEHPFVGCNAAFGGAVYAGFYIQIYCAAEAAAPMPGNPSPYDTATNVQPDADLFWSASALRNLGDETSDGLQAAQALPEAMEDQTDLPEEEGRGSEPEFRCATHERWLAKAHEELSSAGGCAVLGVCDLPDTRDLFIPTGDTFPKTFRLTVHVFCEDDWSDCASDATEVESQINRLNLDYLEYQDWRIDFTYELQLHNDSVYRYLTESEINPMKNAYAYAPDTTLNIFVAYLDIEGWYSFATFPWDGDALGNTGGIFMDERMWSAAGKVLGHEVGHCLGLYHTFRSPYEVSGCSDPCYELAVAPSDFAGDFCSDTAPTPRHWECADPEGEDECSDPAFPWGSTNYRNYMSYTWCRTEWTPQQMGRGQCWSTTELGSWMAPQTCSTTFEVYFGLDDPPTEQICTETTANTCDPGELECDTTYYWQVVSNSLIGSTEGHVWSFSTIPGGGDCNNNSTPDNCEVALGQVEDCQPNGVPDECDIADGTSQDIDHNDIPDECLRPVWPVEPATPPYDARKNRYISIDSSAVGTASVAIEVQLASMKRCSGALGETCSVDDDCKGYCDNNPVVPCEDDRICGGGTCIHTSPCIEHSDVGSVLGWVGTPYNVPGGCSPAPCGPADWAARVVPHPVYRAWTEDPLHVGDCEIIPVASYSLRPTPDGVTFEPPLVIGTIRKPGIWHYADVAGAVDGDTGQYTPPDGNVSVVDVQAFLLTVKNYPSGSPFVHRTWVDLHGLEPGSPPNYIPNVSDLMRILFGFDGRPYNATPDQEDPGDCP